MRLSVGRAIRFIAVRNFLAKDAAVRVRSVKPTKTVERAERKIELSAKLVAAQRCKRNVCSSPSWNFARNALDTSIYHRCRTCKSIDASSRFLANFVFDTKACFGDVWWQGQGVEKARH